MTTLLAYFINYSPQKFRIANKYEAWGLMLWNFYGRNLQMFICTLLDFFPGKHFLPNVCGYGRKPILEGSSIQVLHSGRIQRQDKAENARDKHSSLSLSLIATIKSFITLSLS
jgi:hypothetical protein